MPENDTADKPERAEERTRETQSFMRSVRRATRRRYMPDVACSGGISEWRRIAALLALAGAAW